MTRLLRSSVSLLRCGAVPSVVVAAALLGAMPALATDVVAQPADAPSVADVVAQPADTPSIADTGAADSEGQILSFGEGDQKIHLVRHGELWSMHGENVIAARLFELWHEAGGPQVIAKMYLEYPFTLSVHRESPERIIERVLEGYSFTLHYDQDGRLERVRVYSPQPTRVYKTPRLVESLGGWRQVETTPAP